MTTALTETNKYLVPLLIRHDGQMEIRHLVDGSEEGILVWNETKFINSVCPDLDILDKELHTTGLLNADGAINGDVLGNLVKNSYGDDNHARFVAIMTNAHRVRLQDSCKQSEMALQQLVFNPISGILYCFAPNNYFPALTVSSGPFQFFNKQKTPTFLPGIKPDAAITWTRNGHVVLAHMELAAQEGSDLILSDIFKCIQTTCISAIGLVSMGIDDKITIPFILNQCEIACLYTTIAVKDQLGSMSLTISKIGDFDFTEDRARAKCIALLAVLLSKLKVALSTIEGQRMLSNISSFRGFETTLQLDNNSTSHATNTATLQPDKASSSQASNPITSQANTTITSQANTTITSQANNTTTSQTDNAADTSHGMGSCKSRRTNSRSYPKRNDSSNDCEEVATAGGNIINLHLDNRMSSNSKKYPHYFVGELLGKSPVLVKVWKEEDDDSPKNVKTEIDLLKLAYNYGVPCPRVIDHFTQTSIDFNNNRYHRLVTTQLVNDSVKSNEVRTFGISLIDTVLQLHNNVGILHCNINPTTVCWDSSAKLASLIDFGHSQLASGSTAYIGTIGEFTAPEVYRMNKPHCCQSEAYSIGKTLLVICSSQSDTVTKQMSQVEAVGKKLSVDDPNIRLGLYRARRELIAIFHP